ncbi:acyl carrier protein [Streptomonospora salina]|uniref:Acyl carrier protein n=1 Tax=Streptomonospora salina TaxID=104205 RepID=A0A841ED09_9ACTN|nr:acyl carrier protein [Streptomonospora salina]MBB6001012.1 acyl carrier protein [Streptomonospora salina]
MTADSGVPEISDIELWLLGRLAFYLRCTEDDIAPETPLAELGMDSVYAVTLVGDIEDVYDLEVDPTLAWDYPTARAIAGYLHACLDTPAEDAR